MKQCPSCKLELPSAPQRVLEHIGAHILFDPAVKQSSQPCGLCLRPSPICVFHLKKGKGSKANPKIDNESSACANLIAFKYGTASSSGPSNPCTNVPISCPFCSSTASAVWKYNMKEHLKAKHPNITLSAHTLIWKICETEREEMKRIWSDRKTIKTKRMSKKRKIPLEISEAHSSRLALT